MMRGSNKLELNTATMVEALQFWLDAQFAPGKSPKVTHVAMVNRGLNQFDVSVTERKPDEAKS
jgi:hypothetical protein